MRIAIKDSTTPFASCNWHLVKLDWDLSVKIESWETFQDFRFNVWNKKLLLWIAELECVYRYYIGWLYWIFFALKLKVLRVACVIGMAVDILKKGTLQRSEFFEKQNRDYHLWMSHKHNFFLHTSVIKNSSSKIGVCKVN